MHRLRSGVTARVLTQYCQGRGEPGERPRARAGKTPRGSLQRYPMPSHTFRTPDRDAAQPLMPSILLPTEAETAGEVVQLFGGGIPYKRIAMAYPPRMGRV